MPPENFWLPFESDFQIALVTTQSCITWSKKGGILAQNAQNLPKWQKLLEIIFVLLYIILA